VFEAALYYWRAVLLQAESSGKYTVEEAFQGFIGCYAIQDRAVDGFLFIAKEVMARKQKDVAIQYINQALAIEPDNKEAIALKQRFETGGALGAGEIKGKKRENKFQPQWGTPEARNPSAMTNKTPEDLYEYGSTLFSRKNYEHCADVFELSCKRSGNTLGPSCSNAVCCRMMIMDYGFN
jgi:tetratricopeptide (TPR) repeat protein